MKTKPLFLTLVLFVTLTARAAIGTPEIYSYTLDATTQMDAGEYILSPPNRNTDNQFGLLKWIRQEWWHISNSVPPWKTIDEKRYNPNLFHNYPNESKILDTRSTDTFTSPFLIADVLKIEILDPPAPPPVYWTNTLYAPPVYKQLKNGLWGTTYGIYVKAAPYGEPGYKPFAAIRTQIGNGKTQMVLTYANPAKAHRVKLTLQAKDINDVNIPSNTFQIRDQKLLLGGFFNVTMPAGKSVLDFTPVWDRNIDPANTWFWYALTVVSVTEL